MFLVGIEPTTFALSERRNYHCAIGTWVDALFGNRTRVNALEERHSTIELRVQISHGPESNQRLKEPYAANKYYSPSLYQLSYRETGAQLKKCAD